VKKIVLLVAAITTLAFASVAAAQTSGAHFTQSGFPLCTDTGTQLVCTAELAGLGNETVVANLSAPNATATNLICQNKGGNQAPGQNPAVPTTATGQQTILQPKNGRASIDVATAVPTISPKAAGCPNGNWEVIVGDVEFTSYTLTINQGGALVVTCSGTFANAPSDNGQTNTPTCTFA
jgi:hypothetical protein